MISHPRLKLKDWEISLHDEDDENAEFITLVKFAKRTFIVFTDDSDTEVTFAAEDIDDIIQALTDLKPYIKDEGV